jgi:hypothetical protein
MKRPSSDEESVSPSSGGGGPERTDFPFRPTKAGCPFLTLHGTLGLGEVTDKLREPGSMKSCTRSWCQEHHHPRRPNCEEEIPEEASLWGRGLLRSRNRAQEWR